MEHLVRVYGEVNAQIGPKTAYVCDVCGEKIHSTQYFNMYFKYGSRRFVTHSTCSMNGLTRCTEHMNRVCFVHDKPVIMTKSANKR